MISTKSILSLSFQIALTAASQFLDKELSLYVLIIGMISIIITLVWHISYYISIQKINDKLYIRDAARLLLEEAEKKT